jgi:hypothetical protein
MDTHRRKDRACAGRRHQCCDPQFIAEHLAIRYRGNLEQPGAESGRRCEAVDVCSGREVPCRVSVKVHWVTSEPHHIVAVHAGSGSRDESNWYTSDPGSTAAHEFGHMLGLPDEYAQASCPGRAPVGTGTIMDTNSSFIPRRMVQWIADEIGSDIQ